MTQIHSYNLDISNAISSDQSSTRIYQYKLTTAFYLSKVNVLDACLGDVSLACKIAGSNDRISM